jgi:hypothetical protein
MLVTAGGRMELTAATASRWVTAGVAGEEYMDFVRYRRSATHRAR